MHISFVFKQKTAYEMRMSDWSSDVCSSDLARLGAHSRGRTRHAQGPLALPRPPATLSRRRRRRPIRVRMTASTGKTVIVATDGACKGNPRSEEHTSELQSLMRISYAVFCLKKKHHADTLIDYPISTQD